MVVVTASTFAGYFLYEAVNGFNTDFISTTIKTKSIQDYPFPAVTFHSGDFNSEKDFERTFLNQFQLTRYTHEKTHPLQMEDNQVFKKMFHWLIGPMKNYLFGKISEYLIKDQRFIKTKGRIFTNEVCEMMALKKVFGISMTNNIYDIYNENLYKYNGFKRAMSLIKREVKPSVYEMTKAKNLTKSEIFSVCNDPSNKHLKEEIQSAILSFLFLSLQIEGESRIGAGDLVASHFRTGLTDKRLALYQNTNLMFSRIFYELINVNLPGSVFEIPKFFATTNKYADRNINRDFLRMTINYMKSWLLLTDISDYAMRNYYYLALKR